MPARCPPSLRCGDLGGRAARGSYSEPFATFAGGSMCLAVTMTLSPRWHQQIVAHRSPGEYVEHCVSLARCITNEQFSQLVTLQLRSGESVDKRVHYAVQEYLCRIGTPNRQNQ